MNRVDPGLEGRLRPVEGFRAEGGESAVDGDGGSRDPAGLISQEEPDGSGYLPGPAPAGVLQGEGGGGLWGIQGREFVFHGARKDGIEPDAIRAVIPGQFSGEIHESPLGDAVCDVPRPADPVRGGDQDHRATFPLEEKGDDGPAHAEDGVKVVRDASGPFVVRGFVEERVPRDPSAGLKRHPLQLAELSLENMTEPVHVGWLTQVTLEGMEGPTSLVSMRFKCG